MIIKDYEKQFSQQEIEFDDGKSFIILVGANNSGKSTVLRSISKEYSKEAFVVDVNRTILKGEGPQDKGYLKSVPSYVTQSINQSDDNTVRNTQTLQDYFNLDNDERKPIIDWYNKYFPNSIYEERERKANDASPMLLKVNGYPITKQGSGMRATLEIFIKLFDPKVKVLCIDEPELGLEPTLQKYLFQALRDAAKPDKKIIIATHSHHFLDSATLGNNYICERDSDGKIKLSVVNDDYDLRNIIFRLLGNTLASYMLPGNILIVEGVSDVTFPNPA